MKKIFCILLSATLFIFTCAAVVAVDNLSKKEQVAAMVNAMTLEEKITQTFMMAARTWDNKDVTKMNDEISNICAKYKFGSVILFAENIKKTGDTLNLCKDFQKANTRNGGLPLLIATDQEGGLVYRLGSGTALPGNMAIAATGKTRYAFEAGRIIGDELQAAGINCTLAPVLDVNNNAANPVIGIRSFSDNSTRVSNYGKKFIEGLAETNIASCAKHFPGHGDTATDSHYGLPVVKRTYAKLQARELKPFKSAIEGGVDMIMTAHILYPNVDNTKLYSDKTGKKENRPATMSKKIVTKILKGNMGFEGVVVTDGMNMQGVTDTYGQVQAAVEALAAGCDLICMPTIITKASDSKKIDKLISGIKQAVKEGYITEERLDDAVTRILTLKSKRGILEYSEDALTVENANTVVGSDENRALEREMSAKAITVVKNKDKTLPLKVTKKSKVLVLAPYENETAQVAMAWNRAKDAGTVPEGATIKMYCYSEKSKVSGQIKKLIDWANRVIVISEISSLSKMSYSSWYSGGPQNFTKYCYKNNKPSVVMSVYNPYDCQLYPYAKARVVCYGCKGSSADPTEVLFDKTTASKAACGPNIVAGVEVILGTYGASGKLPVNIPKYNAKTGKFTSKIFYKRGYGKTYKAKAQ